jgi:hypothetical protein
VEPDDVSRKVCVAIPPSVAVRNIHAMNHADAAGVGESIYLFYHKLVMAHKLVVVFAVREILFATAVMVQSSERRRVDR